MQNMFKIVVLMGAYMLIGEVKSRSRQSLDVDSILEIVRSYNNDIENDNKHKLNRADENLYETEELNDLNKIIHKGKNSLYNGQNIRQYNYLNSEDILQELDKRNKRKPNKFKIPKYDYDQIIESKHSDVDMEQNKVLNDKALSELLTKNVLGEKAFSNSRLTPSSLVSYSGQTGDKKKISDYSNIYIILNPFAIKKSKNLEELNSLLSQVLSLTGQSNKFEKSFKQNRYKDFPLKKKILSRRLRRDSRESKVSIENDYKPKRMRDRGGVGSAGGRTAIPYIRNHGDIYERDR
ncbi:hypothetical protein ACJJTC_002815 [Scirpophaga incertulas]